MDRRSFIAGGGAAMIPALCPASPFVLPTTMVDVIKHLGLQEGLKVVLDAGDINCADGSNGCVDVSGNGYTFVAGGGEPLYEGVYGRQSSGDYWFSPDEQSRTFRIDTNPSWVHNLHKNNAIFTFAVWSYWPSASGDVSGILVTTGVEIGMDMQNLPAAHSSSQQLTFIVHGGVAQVISSLRPNLNVWNFEAITVNEAEGTITFQLNGAQETKALSYSSPSSGNTTNELGVRMDEGRLNSAMIWEGTRLTPAQMLTLYETTKAKFGH